MPRNSVLVAVLVVIVGVQSVFLTKLLWAVPSKDIRAPQAVSKPSMLEPVAGTTLKRVILTSKAAERAGIAVGKVNERQVVRTMVVAGEVTGPGGDTLKQTVALPAKGGEARQSLMVNVAFSSENARLDASKPARIVRLGQNASAVTAVPTANDGSSGGKGLQYRFESVAGGPVAGERVRVEIPHLGNGELRKTVPYSAVIYDATGVAWVYTNPEPSSLSYVRERIDVDFVEGDVAVLKSGPATGTVVVSAGAMLLWGSELGK